MCGIAGVVISGSECPSRELLAQMISRVHHRGPDGSGVHVDGPCGLAHARLSIIDLGGGAQPMSSADGALSITFNGEIFNYVELRAELMRRGRRFRTSSDTEVVLQAYAELGEDCVQEFNGQWAFAIWDRRKRRLFASRDRMGVRPFYYARLPGAFVFASEVKSLFAHPRVSRAIDPRGLDQLFTTWATLAPRTVFQGVEELPPGSSLAVDAALDARTFRHYEPDYEATPGRPGDDEERAGELLTLLTDATRLRLRADVPVGAYLSGGLDSSVVAALVRRASSAKLNTFSVTFDDAEFDESTYQREVADHLGVEHQSIRCTHADIARVFPEVVWHAEKPMLRTAPAPLFMLSQLVRAAGFKVVLTGEGADEVLGGYDIFKEAKVRRFWARKLDSPWRPLLLQRLYPYLPNLQQQSSAYRRAFFHVRDEDLASPFFSHLPRWELTSRVKIFYSRDFQDRLAGVDVQREIAETLPARFQAWSPLAQAQFLEATQLLPGYILSSQGDRVAMAHGVEGRFPFLDHRVVRFGAGLPPRLKMHGLIEKYLLKRAAKELVPERVRARPKQPYRAPDAESFFDVARGVAREAYVRDVLDPGRVAAAGIFAPEPVDKLVAKVARGKALGAKDSMAFIGVLSTQLLVERFVQRLSA